MANAGLEISRLCRKPDVFAGDRAKWCDFRMDMTNYMAAAAVEYLNDLQVAAYTNEALDDTGDANLRHRSVVLYSVLCSYLSGDAKSIAATFESTHNGFELWRVLSKEMEPNSGIRKLALGRRISVAEVMKGKSEGQFASALRAWEKEIEQYNKIPGVGGGTARFDEHMQIGILMEMAPSGMKDHLQTGPAIRSYADIRERVQTYLELRGAWNLGDGALGPTPMEVDAVGKSKGKGDGCMRCGDKNHVSKDCPWQNEYCHKCGKRGHISRACLSQSPGKGKGDRGGKGWSKDAGGGKKGKGRDGAGGKGNWQKDGGNRHGGPGGKSSWQSRAPNCYVCGSTDHRAHECSRRWQAMQVGNVQEDPWNRGDPWSSASSVAGSGIAPRDSVSQAASSSQMSTPTAKGKGAGSSSGIGHMPIMPNDY